jgi:hypothetical protein
MSGAIEEAAKRWLTDPAYQKVHKKEFKGILLKDLHFLKVSYFHPWALLRASVAVFLTLKAYRERAACDPQNP